MGFEAYGNCYSALSVALSIKLSSIKRHHIACQAEGNVAEALLIWLCVGKVSDFMHLYLMLNSMRLYCAKINTSWGGVEKPLPYGFFFGSDPLRP